METVEKMFEGPLDVVGDIHGQIDALRDLLGHLRYAPDGSHPEKRKLIFVGDLVDRGPDSVAVVEQVAKMVQAGNAQCVLGNHELNILRESKRDDNNWYFNETTWSANGQRVSSADERAAIWDFFSKLPLALERDDLRVIHACWHPDSIEKMQRASNGPWDAGGQYQRFEAKIAAELQSQPIYDQFKQEKKEFEAFINYRSNDPYDHWPDSKLLEGHAEVNEIRQMGNPMSVLTSGEERAAKRTYPAGGKFRFVDRIAWWKEYNSERAVIIGHYWRLFDMNIRNKPGATGIDLFKGTKPQQWLGPKRNVYCVDFSVGGRSHGYSHKTCRLAAVRWPEACVMFDDGEELRTDRRRDPSLPHDEDESIA